MTIKLDLDPRIDLTQPILKQVEQLDAASRGPSPFGSVDEAAQIMRWLQSALIRMRHMREATNTSLRIELEFSGIRVWGRRGNIRKSSAMSWKVLQKAQFNIIVSALNEVMLSIDFAQSPAGKVAKKHRPNSS